MLAAPTAHTALEDAMDFHGTGDLSFNIGVLFFLFFILVIYRIL